MNNTINLIDIIKELNLDDEEYEFDDVKDTIRKYNFEIDDIKYSIKFILSELEIGESILEVSFSNISEIEKIRNKNYNDIEDSYNDLQNAKFGKTNTGKQQRVFNVIYNAVVKYILKFKPTYLKYDAIEKNRQSLYNMLISRSSKETNLKFITAEIEPETQEKIQSDSRFIYKVEY